MDVKYGALCYIFQNAFSADMGMMRKHGVNPNAKSQSNFFTATDMDTDTGAWGFDLTGLQ